MHTNETGREPEPTDAELELVLDLFRAAKRLAGNRSLYDVDALIEATNATPWAAIKRLSGARPMPESGVSRAEMLKAATDTLLKAEAERMPDTPAPDEERRTVCVYDKYDPDYVYRPDESGEYRMQVDRRSGTTPATPVLGANQCEHGQLKRQCLTCELQARIADLERDNAALGAELEAEKNRIHDRMLQWRGIYPDGGDAVCKACQGAGVKVYGDSTMWRGGIGGQVITRGVCDGCWGSGNPDRPWTNLRTLLPAPGKEAPDAE